MLTVNEAESMLRGYYDDEDSARRGTYAWGEGKRKAKANLNEAIRYAELHGLGADGKPLEDEHVRTRP